MCGPAVIPVLKFIAPMVLPNLVNRFFGPKDQKPATYKPTATPGQKVAGTAAVTGDDEEKKDETTASETEQSVNQKLSRKRQSDPNKSTGASDAPAASGLGGNITGANQQTGGINTGIPSATYA